MAIALRHLDPVPVHETTRYLLLWMTGVLAVDETVGE
jgi:hypothetical protein